MNQSYGLSFDKTLFLSYHKAPKLKMLDFYLKEVDLA